MARLSTLWFAGLTAAAILGLVDADAAPAGVRTFTRSDAHGEVTVAAIVRGSGPLVVLVPSLGRGAKDFDDLAARLALAGFEVASVDPRGIGGSRGATEGLTLFDYADDAVAVARALSDRPAVFVGHAYGNRVVRALAARHPEAVSRVIPLASGGQVPMAAQVLSEFNKVFDQTLPPAQHLAAVKAAFFAPGNDASVWAGGWYPSVAEAQNAASRATPNGDWVDAGRAPILIVQGQHDLVAAPANAEALKLAHPDRVTVVTLPHAGHAMLPEQPKAIADILIHYLRGS